jgi:hypothetical protein
MDIPSPEIAPYPAPSLYGHLQGRDGRVLHPGANKALCRVETADAMARAGWLKRDGDRYVITPEGASAEALY